MENEVKKVCNHCHIEKPATLEFFSRNAATPDKLQGRCKSCFSKAAKTVSAVKGAGWRLYTREEFDAQEPVRNLPRKEAEELQKMKYAAYTDWVRICAQNGDDVSLMTVKIP
jgi:hypothetical protein